jgi:hypothetical protein
LPEIGFVFQIPSRNTHHAALNTKQTRPERSRRIGFVFSNTFISDFGIRASDFRPQAGNWLCFA